MSIIGQRTLEEADTRRSLVQETKSLLRQIEGKIPRLYKQLRKNGYSRDFQMEYTAKPGIMEIKDLQVVTPSGATLTGSITVMGNQSNRRRRDLGITISLDRQGYLYVVFTPGWFRDRCDWASVPHRDTLVRISEFLDGILQP